MQNTKGHKTVQEAIFEKHQAIDEVASSESANDWMPYATRYLKDYLRTHRIMHVDDLWASGLEKPKGSVRVLGAVIRKAQDAEWIEHIMHEGPDGGVVARPSVNGRMGLKPIWRSKLYNASTSTPATSPNSNQAGATNV